MEWLTDPQAWIALATLTALELVLGIDNIIFISILVDRLRRAAAEKARRLGLVSRDVHAHRAAPLARLDHGLQGSRCSRAAQDISGRDLVLIGGGLFLLWKSTREIHQLLEGEDEAAGGGAWCPFVRVIAQVIVIDIVFSLDSIVTAVGMVTGSR